jgi:hypothetical protein
VLLFLFDKENENGVSNGVLTKDAFFLITTVSYRSPRKSQSLLSRAVYLCQFFLSSIENFVCMVRQFSVFYPITTSSFPGKPCHFVGQGLSNSQI